MVGQAVQQRAGQALGAERLSPFVERQVAGNVSGISCVAQRRIIRHRPVQPRQLDQARYQSCLLPQRKVEKRLQRQAQRGGAVRKTPGAAKRAIWCR